MAATPEKPTATAAALAAALGGLSLADKIEAVLALHGTLSSDAGVSSLFDNYKYREILVREMLLPLFPGITMLAGRSGADFACCDSPTIAAGEIKTTNYKRRSKDKWLKASDLGGQFQFDKQNDPVRRVATLEYDAFVFALSFDNVPRVAACFFGDSALAVRNIIAAKQAAFVDAHSKRRGQGRDTVSVSFSDLFEADPLATIISRDTAGVVMVAENVRLKNALLDLVGTRLRVF